MASFKVLIELGDQVIPNWDYILSRPYARLYTERILETVSKDDLWEVVWILNDNRYKIRSGNNAMIVTYYDIEKVVVNL